MKMIPVKGYYKVIHEHFATDRYQYGSTIVEASSKEEAMVKLNTYLETQPEGVYTAKPCENISYIHELVCLS